MNQRERKELDRHITGNFGEDQYKSSQEEDAIRELEEELEEHGEQHHIGGGTCRTCFLRDRLAELKGELK